MSIYTNKLKEQHVQIKNLLTDVQKYIATDETKKQFVAKLSKLLKNHIETEDKELYVVLKKTSEKSPAVQRKLNLFAKGWEEISEFAEEYIKKYSSGNFDGKFLHDTGKILAKLKTRMLKEEVGLFSEYDKIVLQ